MVAEKEHGVQKSAGQPKVIPDYLICEVMDGQPLYYKGYKDVLSKKKKLEDIMGSSTLQGLITMYIAGLCAKCGLDEKYFVIGNEAGIHLDKNNNLAGDILIYDTTVLTSEKIDVHYADVPPKVNIEVDVMIDLEKMKDYQYIQKKIEKLHAFGTEKVIWILTATKQVIVAANGQPWVTHNWNSTIELLDGVTFNIGDYLRGRGIK